jgi:hypothetical protein
MLENDCDNAPFTARDGSLFRAQARSIEQMRANYLNGAISIIQAKAVKAIDVFPAFMSGKAISVYAVARQETKITTGRAGSALFA